jgi:hypothetical protein
LSNNSVLFVLEFFLEMDDPGTPPPRSRSRSRSASFHNDNDASPPRAQSQQELSPDATPPPRRPSSGSFRRGSEGGSNRGRPFTSTSATRGGSVSVVVLAKNKL